MSASWAKDIAVMETKATQHKIILFMFSIFMVYLNLKTITNYTFLNFL